MTNSFAAAGSPCDYCRSIDEECSFDAAKRRQKPYYFVSEEEYRLLHLVCQKCLPDEELTVTNLRRLASQSTQAASQTIASTPIAQDDITDDYEGARASVGASEEREDVPLPEIVNLHKDLGCLLSDAQGEHRNSHLKFWNY
jgi:aldehyde dehydrogenase (NAD+)